MTSEPRARVPRWLLAVLGWVAVVAVTSTVAWLAISRAGDQVLDAASTQLPSTTTSGPAPVVPSGGAPDPATSSEAPAPPAAGPVAQSVTVAGGSVTVTCAGATPTLGSAVPNGGWTVTTENQGSDRLRVEFRSAAGESKVRASCVSGTPTFEVEEDDD